MPIEAKGDFEVIYVPTKGLDYSRPYNTLDKEFLAPGTFNTQSINGFLTSAPWVGDSPYSTVFAGGEVVLGQFPINYVFGTNFGTYSSVRQVLIVTNIAVYCSGQISNPIAPTFSRQDLRLIHTWNNPLEINPVGSGAGNQVSFVQLNGATVGGVDTAQIFFTAPFLNGVFVYTAFPSGPGSLQTATTYVCGNYILVLGDRLIVGECRFPTGGGPLGNTFSPTVAWSGVGSFIGAGINDPWNPANFATLSGNIGGFNLLEDSPDQITGLANLGRSAMIYRNWGMTEMDPGPSGIDPFLFYQIWTSIRGVGAKPNTVAQYGSLTLALADDNVYSMSLQGGLTPIGSNIIPKILTDLKALGFQSGQDAGTNILVNYWFFATIVVIAGQIHYLLCLNALSGQFPPPVASVTTTCTIYDLNVAEGSWHVLDMNKYYHQDGTLGPGFQCLTCAPIQAEDSWPENSSINAITPYILVAAYTDFTNPSGQLFQLVPLDYDVNTNPFIAYWAALYQPLAVPNFNINFRGEVVSLGHKINMRRLRVQSMNAPFPVPVGGYQGQLVVQLNGSQSGPLQSQTVNVGVDATMKTYYGDVRLGDEMIQASVFPIINGGNPWQNLPLARFSTISIIGSDTKSTTA